MCGNGKWALALPVFSVSFFGLFTNYIDVSRLLSIQEDHSQCDKPTNYSIFLPRNVSAHPCVQQQVHFANLSSEAVLSAYVEGPSTKIPAGVQVTAAGFITACFCPVERGVHNLHARLDYRSRKDVLADPPAPSPVFIGRDVGSFLDKTVGGTAVSDSTRSIDCGVVSRQGVWWSPRWPQCVPPTGLAARRDLTFDALARCFTKQVHLTMLGDSVSERFCKYVAWKYSPGCCADCTSTDRCQSGQPACTRVRANGLYNDADTYVNTLLEAKLVHAHGSSVIVLNVGLWDVAYGQLAAFPSKLSRVLDAAVIARSKGIRVLWRTTSAVHPNVARQQGKLLDKHAFLNQPRVDEINMLSTELVRKAGVEMIDIAGMTALRPEYLEKGDMRHYDDRMHGEMTQLLAQAVCRTRLV